MIRRPPRSTLDRSSAASEVYKRQQYTPLRTPFVREVTSAGAFETYADMGDLPWPVQNAGKEGGGGTDARAGGRRASKRHGGGAAPGPAAPKRGFSTGLFSPDDAHGAGYSASGVRTFQVVCPTRPVRIHAYGCPR